MSMVFLYFLCCLFFSELIFHIVCFKALSASFVFFSLFFSIIYAVVFTFLICIFRKEKVRLFIFRLLLILVAITFVAELVYYQIYNSVFNFNGIVFAGALKDGYDKILLTVFENLYFILLFFVPFLFSFKKPIKEFNLNRVESLFLVVLMLISFGYNKFAINYFNRDDQYSYYNLMNKIDAPYLNLKSFGLNTTLSLSIKRKITNFTPKNIMDENIYANRRTALNDSLVVTYNDTDIDFLELYNTTSDPAVKELHKYFMEQTPTVKNEFTGLFSGKNVIFVVAESFDEVAIDKDLTPTLYKLKNEGIVFNNYFSPKYPASTADGEYMLEWGTLPIIGEDYSLIDMVYNTNPYLLPRLLKKMNYSTYAYHDYFGYYNYRKKYFSTLNFNQTRYCQDGFNMYCDRFHGSDMDMMDQSIDDFINQEKFFAYYITLSGHGSYDDSNFVATKHLSRLSGYNYPSQLKYYLAANIDFDLAMEKLVSSLKVANKLDDTVIIISSDHSPYYLTDQQINIKSSIQRNNSFDRNRGSLIIYNSALKKHYSIDKYAMNIDVLPTVLNMLGIEYDSRLIIGKDIMASNNEGVVIFPDRSWANNKGTYDINSGVFTPYTDNVDDKYISKMNQEVYDKFKNSTNLQYTNYYKYIFGE